MHSAAVARSSPGPEVGRMRNPGSVHGQAHGCYLRPTACASSGSAEHDAWSSVSLALASGEAGARRQAVGGERCRRHKAGTMDETAL
jgi:hypothetical protein